MAENKNQSIAGWPSVTGSRSTGLDLRGLNPQLQRNAKVLEAYQKRYASDVSAVKQMGDATARLTKITQDINARNFARQDQLLTARQGNFQRMNEMYGNYFQQFGNVLNESALKFLDEHSNIGVPTLTAIMAGYEHAKASRAQQELAMLDRQAKMAEAAYALDKQRADLEALKDQNAALSQQAALENQIKAIDAINKSQNQYYSDVANLYAGRGVAGGRGTGVAGAGGLGSGSAAGSFQAPVTGGAGVAATGAVAGGGATGVFDPNSPEFLAAQKQIADSKAAQTAGQGVQYGPVTQQMVDVDKQITDWSDLSGTPLFAGAVGTTGATWALNKYGNRAQVGYIKPSELARYNQAKGLVGQVNTALNASGYDAARMQVQADMAGSKFYNKAGGDLNRYTRIIEQRDALRTRLANKGLTGTLTPREQRILTSLTPNVYELESLKNIQDMKNIKSNYYDPLNTQKTILENQLKNATTENIKAYNKANNFARFRGSVARGAGKLAGYATKGLWAASMVDLANSFADEGVGIVAGATTWAKNTLQDLSGITRQRLAENPDYLRNRPTPTQVGQAASRYVLAAKNNFFNIAGMNTNLGNDIANMTVDRLRALGYDPDNIEISQIIENSKRNPQDSANALEALLRAQGDGSGNLAGTNDSIIKFYNDVLAESAYQRTYATQVNKAAQNQQLTNQQAAEEAEKANMIDPRTHRFLAAMMKHYTDMGRQAGYDFHEGHAIQFANAYMQFVADMESGNKQGAVGSMTSTGTAKSRYQFMDKTFQSAVQWMLDEDERAGNQLLNSNEREILREARTKDANFLDNNGYGNLLGFMTLLYPLKSSVSASKFGSGNPDITGQQMVVDMIQQFKNGGGMTPYLLSNMGAAYSGALHGRMGKKEYADNQNRVTALIQSMYGPDHVATGVYMPNAQIGEFLGNQGIQWDMRYDPVVWRNQWVAENFDKNEKGDDLVPKSTYKPYEQWKIDNGLNQVRQVGKPEQITMSQYIKRLNDKVDFDNLDPLVKRQLNAMAEEVGKYGRSVQLNSGRRDPVKNDELIRRWESGDREGMVHKPSKNSKHLTGVAFDMQRSGANGLDDIVNNTPELKQKYGDARGMMAAYGFDNNVKNDPVHFSLNEDFRKNNSRSSGWTLPSVASLPFAPVEYPEVVVEPANQGIVDPLDLSAFDGMMPGGVNFSPTNYGVAMEQMGHYNQQLQTPIGWDIDGNPIYQ